MVVKLEKAIKRAEENQVRIDILSAIIDKCVRREKSLSRKCRTSYNSHLSISYQTNAIKKSKSKKRSRIVETIPKTESDDSAHQLEEDEIKVLGVKRVFESFFEFV